MLIKKAPELTYADITPKSLYFNRRNFLRGLGIGAAAIVGDRLASTLTQPSIVQASTKLTTVKSSYTVNEKITPENDVAHYNNFYEFGTDKGDPARNAQSFRTSPWTVSVEGAVKSPCRFPIDLIPIPAPLEERVSCIRCVEAWPSVVPWVRNTLN